MIRLFLCKKKKKKNIFEHFVTSLLVISIKSHNLNKKYVVLVVYSD